MCVKERKRERERDERERERGTLKKEKEIDEKGKEIVRKCVACKVCLSSERKGKFNTERETN